MKKYNLIIGGLLLSLFGCTSVDEPVQIPELSEETAGTTEPLYFMVPDKSRTVADGEKAVEIADRFLKGRGVRSRDAVAANVNRIDLDNGETAMYVVNYGDEGGFVIVSATKDTEPILAYSETGSFDMEKLVGSPVELWIDETKEYVEYSHLLPDSVKVQYAAQWNELTYGKNYLSNLMSRSWGDAEDMARVQEVLNMWYNQGYQVVEKPTSDVHQYPTELNQALDRLSDYRDGDGYTQREKSFLLIKTNSSSSGVQPMVTTKWGQWSPYNASLSNRDLPLGCVTIAVAQIMKYYAKPNGGFEYSKMPDALSEYETPNPTGVLPVFLKIIGDTLETNYTGVGNDDSGVDINKAAEILGKFGFGEAKVIDYDFSQVTQNLKNGPLILRGARDGGGHEWVCDGFNASSNDTEYKIYTFVSYVDDLNPLASFNLNYNSTISSSAALLHMNWGWAGQSDGYYYENDWSVPLNGELVHYKNGRKAIAGLK